MVNPAPGGGSLVQVLEAQLATASATEKTHDYTWQATSGAGGRNAFKEEIVSAVDKLQAFAVVEAGSPYVKVIHGVRKYYNGAVAAELRGKFLARTGDWTEELHPHIVQLPDDVWDWEKLKLATDPVSWAAHASLGANCGTLWKPAATATAEDNVQLPKLLLLPPSIAKYAVGGDPPRTAHELYTFIGTQVTAGTDGVSAENAKLLKQWCIAAGQQQMGTRSNKSGVAITVTGITNTTPAFLKWAKQRLVAYLPGPTRPMPQVHAGGGVTEAHLTSLTNSISNLASTKQTTEAEAARKKKRAACFLSMTLLP